MQFLKFVDADPRVAKWPLMQSPVLPVFIVLLYLAFVWVLGPKWMKNKKPLGLQKFMVIYSFSLAAANAWVFNKFGTHGWYRKHSWSCEPVDTSDNEDAVGLAVAVWSIYILKLVELIDTVIFVLRKKTSQITFLHVLHHALVPTVTWYLVVREPGGYNTLFPFINSFVHIVMYSYYGLAALGPSVQKYLWWKKYITVLQIGQFVVIFLSMIRLAISPACKVSNDIVGINLFLATIFLGLFLNFFLKSYKPKQVNITITMNGAQLTAEDKTESNGHDVKCDFGNGHSKDL